MDRVIAWDKTKIEGVAVLPPSYLEQGARVMCLGRMSGAREFVG